MSSETSVSVKSVVWAGGILVFLACVHLAITGLAAAPHIPGWFRGEAWLPGTGGLAELGSPPANVGAFWLVWGSFAVPLGLLGALVARSGRGGRVPPPYVAGGLALWALVGAICFEPSPFVTVLVPCALLLAARRGRRRAGTRQGASGGAFLADPR